MSKHAMKGNFLKTCRTRKNISEYGGLAIGINQTIKIKWINKIKVFYFSLTLIIIIYLTKKLQNESRELKKSFKKCIFFADFNTNFEKWKMKCVFFAGAHLLYLFLTFWGQKNSETEPTSENAAETEF
jgi:hypothetical protein